MHFLARLLHQDSAVSEELAKNEQVFQAELKRFFTSYKIKQDVLEFLQRGEPIHMHLHKLQYALKDEIEVIEMSERTEKEIIQDLKFLSKEQYVRRLEELLSELTKAQSRERYVRHLLGELHDLLSSEARKVRRLLHGEQDLSLGDALIDLLTIERHLVEKLSNVEDFQQLFTDLSLGERRRMTVEGVKSRLHERTKQLMQAVQVNSEGVMESMDGHYISEMTARIFNELENAIMEAVQDGMIEKHPNVDMEFVNSPLFEKFIVRELKLDKSVGKFIPSVRTARAFIDVFREFYNSQMQVKVAA